MFAKREETTIAVGKEEKTDEVTKKKKVNILEAKAEKFSKAKFLNNVFGRPVFCFLNQFALRLFLAGEVVVRQRRLFFAADS